MTRLDENLPGMIGRHPDMLAVYRRVRKVAPTELPVLIIGETGTGKELVARALHELSDRSAGPFVAVNCAAVPETLAEAELFGAEPGAYTGATRRRNGLLKRADGGTLFLDEICSMTPAAQVKLLRVVEERTFRRVGGGPVQRADFRVVAAVSRSVEMLVEQNLLRRDLFHRLAFCRLTLPPLRSRGHDVVSLAEHFLRGSGKRLGMSAREYLEEYAWAGNVRELRGAMESAAVFSDAGEITRDDLAVELDGGRPSPTDRERLAGLLEQHDWNLTETARALGRSRTTLYAWMQEHGLSRPAEVDR